MANFSMDPSTYRQVLKNAQALANLGDLSDVPYDINQLYNIVNELKEMIMDSPGTGGNSDITQGEDGGAKVIGVHVNTTNSEENTLIENYNQGVTFEIKNTQVIGIKGRTGFTGDYCALQTIKQDSSIEGESETPINFTAFQIAYGTDGLYMCRRDALADGSWGEWSEISGATGSGGQIVDSETQPEDQNEGDYWMQHID